jgi:hypothetical protein
MTLEEMITEVSFTRPDTTIAAESEVVLYQLSPLTGKVDNITLHFPNGCNSLVEISCYINQIQILPITGVIALNDATIKFPVGRRVKSGDKLRVKISNKDLTNEHTPSIIWELRGVP